MPNLASALLDFQKEGTAPRLADGAPAINLQGFLVGNAWTDPATDNEGRGLAPRIVTGAPHLEPETIQKDAKGSDD